MARLIYLPQLLLTWAASLFVFEGMAVLQELYRWEAVADAARTALGLRYKLLPTLYTTFKHSHDTGVPIARPLFFGWPHDPVTHTTDQQFMLGDSILVSPVLEEVSQL